MSRLGQIGALATVHPENDAAIAARRTQLLAAGHRVVVVDNLHTDLHECVGHASGQLMPGVTADALKNYNAPIEEARADLFALYYLMDPRLVEWGLLQSEDAAKAGYIEQILNGLFTQLKRIEPGKRRAAFR